jgi:hypothetical protein
MSQQQSSTDINFNLPQRPSCVPRRRSSESSASSSGSETDSPAASPGFATSLPLNAPIFPQPSASAPEMSERSAPLCHQRSRSLEDVIPSNSYVATQVNVFNNLNAPGATNTNIFGLSTIEEEDEEEEEEEEDRGRRRRRGRRDRRASTPVERPPTRRGLADSSSSGLSGTDRGLLPSQRRKLSPPTTLSRQGAVRCMVNIPPPQTHATTDGFPQQVTPFAVPQPSVSASEMAGFGMPHREGFSENKVSESKVNRVEGTDVPAVAAAPFRRGHRRNKTTLSSEEDFAPCAVPRNDPVKGVAQNAEGFRAVGGQHAMIPSIPESGGPHLFGYDSTPTKGPFSPADIKLRQQKISIFDNDDEQPPSTPTPLTNFLGHPRMDNVSESSSPSISSSPPMFDQSHSSSKDDLIIFPPGHTRKAFGGFIYSYDSSSTIASESWNAYDPVTLSPKSTPEKEKGDKASLSGPPPEFSPNALAEFEDLSESSLLPQSDIPSTSPRMLRRVGTFNFGPQIDPFDLPLAVATARYPLENVTYASATDGTDVFDHFYARGTWPRQGARHVRFNSEPHYAPAHVRTDLDSSNGSNMIFIDDEEADWEAPRRTLRVVNGSDQDEDDEATELPSPLWNVTIGDKVTMASSDAWKRAARDQEIKVRKPTDTSAEDSDLEPFDGSEEQAPVIVVKKHKRNSSLELFRRALDTVGKYTAAHAGVAEPTLLIPVPTAQVPRRHLPSDTDVPPSECQRATAASAAPVVRPPLPANTGVKDKDFQFPAGAPEQQRVASAPIPRRPLPRNTGIMNANFQFPAAAAAPEQVRVVSMPVLSATATEPTKKHRRSGSISKLLAVFGSTKDGQEGEKKKSLGRHIGHRLRDSIKSVWAGDFPTGEGYQAHYTSGSGMR